MKWKFALALFALVIPLASAHLGCAGDTCDLADDMVQNCSVSMTSSSSSSGNSVTYDCTGARYCQSLCINKSTCAEINGNLPTFAQCITACDGQ